MNSTRLNGSRLAGFTGKPSKATPSSLKATLITLLKAEPTLSDLVAARIYPSHPARGAALPSITVSFASDARAKTLIGHTDQRLARALFTARASTDLTAEAIAKALDAFLPTLQRTTHGAIEIVTVLQQPETEDYAAPNDGTDTGPRIRIVDYRFDYRYRA